MRKFAIVLTSKILFLLLSTQTVFAQEYTVPIIIGDETYTLTVSIRGEDVSVISSADDLEIGEIARVKDDSELTVDQDSDKLNAILTIGDSELVEYLVNPDISIGGLMEKTGIQNRLEAESNLAQYTHNTPIFVWKDNGNGYVEENELFHIAENSARDISPEIRAIADLL